MNGVDDPKRGTVKKLHHGLCVIVGTWPREIVMLPGIMSQSNGVLNKAC
jgi:hypothetical protein